MLPEYHVVFHVDDVHGVIRIIVLEELQYFELDTRLVVVLLLVLDDLQSYMLLRFVIETLDCDAKGSATEVLDYLVTIRDMVFHHDLVVAL